MSFWSQLTGQDGARRAEEATSAANAGLLTGYTNAGQSLSQARAAALAALQGGNASSTGYLNTGYDTARGDITSGYDAAKGDVGAGYDTAIGNVDDAYTRSAGLLQPSIDRGNTLADLYATALGGKGADAQTGFYDTYASNDPFREYRDQTANDALRRQYNARGQSDSGRFDMAVSRASLERGTSDLNTYLDRLKAAGEQGQQASGQLAGISANTGQTLAQINQNKGGALAGLDTGMGTALATNATNKGTALATNASNYGAATAGVESDYGKSQAGLATGLSTGQANNLLSGANAQQASLTGGMNNLIGLGSTIINGFTPGKTGTSAFSNIGSTMSSLWNNTGAPGGAR